MLDWEIPLIQTSLSGSGCFVFFSVGTRWGSQMGDAPNRSLHLVDIENLAGGPFTEPDAAILAMRQALMLAQWAPGDHVYIAANRWLLAQVCFVDLGFSCRWLVGRGADGADLRLLDVAADRRMLGRYGRLVVHSGDGIFAVLATEFRHLGRPVAVVAPAGCLSRRLARTASDIRILRNYSIAVNPSRTDRVASRVAA
jgi:hypothetical protein